MSWAITKKAINSDIREPLNYLMWINDLSVNQKSSYVYKDPAILTDLAANSEAVLNAADAVPLLFKGIIDMGEDVGAFFEAVTKDDTGAFAGLVTIFDVLSDSGARDVINASERAKQILGSGVHIYGFRVEKAESNTSDRVEYLHDSIGKTPAHMDFGAGEFNYGDWEDFCTEINRPVMLNYDGTVGYELSRTDQTKKADGVTASDVDNTSYAGNAMSEFKLLYFYRYEDATHEYVYISPLQINENYKAYAHTDDNGNIQDAFYYAMYEGTWVSPRMRSLATGTPFVSETSTTEINRAKANGDGAGGGGTDVDGWWTITKSQRDFINDLLTLITKDCNDQARLGNGNSDNASYLNAGTLKDKGQFFGASNTTTAIKVFYIENYWGNYWQRMAGLVNDGGTIKVKLTPPYPIPSGDTVSMTGFVSTGVTPSGTTGTHQTASKVGGDIGYVPTTAGGSATTYWACGLWYNNALMRYALVGGTRTGVSRCGGRTVYLTHLPSVVATNIGSALSFLKSSS